MGCIKKKKKPCQTKLKMVLAGPRPQVGIAWHCFRGTNSRVKTAWLGLELILKHYKVRTNTLPLGRNIRALIHPWLTHLKILNGPRCVASWSYFMLNECYTCNQSYFYTRVRWGLLLVRYVTYSNVGLNLSMTQSSWALLWLMWYLSQWLQRPFLRKCPWD